MIFPAIMTVMAAALQLVAETPPPILEAISGDADPALWRTGDEDTTVYLFGTIHVMPEEAEWESDTLRQVWAETDLLITEADVSSEEALGEARAAAFREAFYLDGRKLADLYTDEEAALINEDLAAFNLSLEALGNQKPWFAMTYLVMLEAASIGFGPEWGVDNVVEDWAKRDAIPVQHFETATQQLGYLVSIPEEEQKQFLMVELDIDEDRTTAEINASRLEFWFYGDAAALWEEMFDEFSTKLPIAMQILLYRRNQDWAAQLDTLIEEYEGTIFVAVGAGHLVGGKNVQHYLAEFGHETVRVNP